MKCIVCGSPAAGLWVRKGSYELYRCSGCSAVFTHPMPSRAELLQLYTSEQYFLGGGTQGYAAGYDVSAGTQSRLYEMILDQIGRPQAGANLLEIGCAEGYFLDAARTRGWDVAGVELSPVAAAAARRTFGLQVFEGALDELSLGPSGYNVVVLLDVIEHLTNPARTVKTATRMLRPGGRLIIKTPDIGSAYARRLGVHWPQIKPPEHLVYFEFASLEKMLEACGCAVYRRQTIGGTGILATMQRHIRAHPRLDCRDTIRALSAIKRSKWVAWLVERASALLGREDSMIVFASKVRSRGADTDAVVCSR
jgi:SAM-dependent methyltransferase